MSLIVLLTALSGLLASFSMLSAGITCMWLRYSLAVLAAYAVFLGLIWCWLSIYKRKLSVNPDALDFPIDFPRFDGKPESISLFEGGSSGGGGAGGSFDVDPASGLSNASAHASFLDSMDLSFDADELILIFVILGLSLCVVVVTVMVIMSAPTLFGEIVVDSALAAGLYRRLKKIDESNWLQTALRRTWLQFTALIVFFAIAGWVFQWYAPSADSIGDVWNKLRD